MSAPDNTNQGFGAESTVESHLDAFQEGTLSGWIWDAAHPEEPLELHLLLGAQRIATYRADRFREDLAAEGIGSGRYGFSIKISPSMLARAEESGQAVHVRLARDPDHLLFTLDLSDRSHLAPVVREFLADRLDLNRLSLLSESLGSFETARHGPASPTTLQGLFEPPASASGQVVAAEGPALFPYADYIRRLNRLERVFATDDIGPDVAHFMHWYLGVYGVDRAPRRAPLSRDILAWLNAPLTVGGQPVSVTRALLWCLAEAGSPYGLADLGEASRYRKMLYWWVSERAPGLNAEDCLVAEAQIDFLRQVPPHWRLQDFPLSNFMEEALLQRPVLVALGPTWNRRVRRTAYLVLLAEAIDEPGLLRFVPQSVLQDLLGGDEPPFEAAARAACQETNVDPVPVTVPVYRQLVARKGFDLDRLRFDTVDAAGHRSEAARLGGLPEQPCADVQVIGPMAKVSGLAQACRLSCDILRRTPYRTAFLDFAMDNLQPEQASAGTPAGAKPQRARVNLIHLNPDMLPIALAYLPDVHQDAYRIGFFFWELDRPADCHRLALDLVDEIWVASDYNWRCFAAATRKPVINVGMAVDVGPLPAREAARAALQRHARIDGEPFVFFTTYDSLSYPARKNPLGLLKAFTQAFPEDDQVRLVIKTHNVGGMPVGFGAKIWDTLLRAAAADRRVSVIDETLPYATVMALKAGSDCYVSLHRSEGLGFGMLEAMRLGVPVVCTAYSGNLDFCDDATAWLVEADEVGVRHDDYAQVSPLHRWAEPRLDSAVAALRGVRRDAAARQRRAAAAAERVATHYSLEAAAQRYGARLEAILGRSPPAA